MIALVLAMTRPATPSQRISTKLSVRLIRKSIAAILTGVAVSLQA